MKKIFNKDFLKIKIIAFLYWLLLSNINAQTILPTFTPIPPICAGSFLAPLPTTSLNGINGIWSPALNNLLTTIYTFTPNAGQDATTTTLEIIVNPVSNISLTYSPFCEGEVTTITANVTPLINYVYNWTVPPGAVNPGNVSSFQTNIEGLYSLNIINTSSTCNQSFETPVISPSSFSFILESNFSCWKTTATDNFIEVWRENFLGVSTPFGNQFVELNATQNSFLYQDILILPGTSISIGFSHRARVGVDVMNVSIGPVDGPYVSLGNFSATTASWVNNSITYTFPMNEVTNYRLLFGSVSTGSGNISVGNFLDNITLTNFTCNSSESINVSASPYPITSPIQID